MRNRVVVELELPKDWKRFQMPFALRNRLRQLLDRQDEKGKLTAAERREALALTELSELLTLIKLRTAKLSG